MCSDKQLYTMRNRQSAFGLALLEILVILWAVIFLSELIWTHFFHLSYEENFKNRQIQLAILKSHLVKILEDLESHRYKIIPVVLNANLTFDDRFKKLDFHSGVHYLQIDPTIYLKFLRFEKNHFKVCPSKAEPLLSTNLLLVGVNGFRISKLEDLNSNSGACSTIRLLDHSSQLVKNPIRAENAALAHPILKEYVLFIDKNGKLKFASFNDAELLEKNTIIEESVFGEFYIEEDFDNRLIKLSYKGRIGEVSVISALLRKDLAEILLSPNL